MSATYVSATLLISGLLSSLGISIMASQPPFFWNFMSFSLMIFFIPLQNTDMPSILKIFCKGFGADLFGFMPNLGELISLKEKDYPEAPDH